MIERFRYHAYTTGVAGHITEPFDEIIPIQASLALPQSGGFGVAETGAFCFKGILSFESAKTVVAGSFSKRDRTFDAVATVTISGLNILSMVTADRVVARIASSHHEDPAKGHSITPVGSYFENLRIAGHKVCVDLATDTFAKFDNAGRVRAAYKKNEDGFRDEFDRLALTDQKGIPEKLCKYFARLGKPALEEPGGVTACSLVRGVDGLPTEFRPVGHVIHIPGFGVIRLAEFVMTDSERTLTMLQVDLGSTPAGSGTVGGAAGNGSGF